MLKLINRWQSLSPKKQGGVLIAAGTACLAGCILLLLFTESIFSTVLLYFSLGFNIIGLYRILWGKK